MNVFLFNFRHGATYILPVMFIDISFLIWNFLTNWRDKLCDQNFNTVNIAHNIFFLNTRNLVTKPLCSYKARGHAHTCTYTCAHLPKRIYTYTHLNTHTHSHNTNSPKHTHTLCLIPMRSAYLIFVATYVTRFYIC